MKNKFILAQSAQGAEIRITFKNKIKPENRVQVRSSESGAKYLKEIWEDFGNLERVESFVVVCLNSKNQIINWAQISSGGINYTLVDVRIIFQTALMSNAVNIMLAHNHPSGNLNPSHADKVLTTKICEAGQTLEIKVIDHIIITAEGYYSFADNGLM